MRVATLLVIAVYVAILQGCSSQHMRADVDPSSNLAEMNSFFVQRSPTDTRGIEKLIATDLLRRGKRASYGDGLTPVQDVDAIVTYVDRWMWDITMYMLELRIDIRDSETSYILASGQSFRTSLVRKDPEGMVEEVITEIMREAEGL